MKKIVLIALALSSSPALAAESTCSIGLVKESIGSTPFSWVLDHTGVRSKMSCDEAEGWAKTLNQRHNNHDNGVEPVKAMIYQG